MSTMLVQHLFPHLSIYLFHTSSSTHSTWCVFHSPGTDMGIWASLEGSWRRRETFKLRALTSSVTFLFDLCPSKEQRPGPVTVWIPRHKPQYPPDNIPSFSSESWLSRITSLQPTLKQVKCNLTTGVTNRSGFLLDLCNGFVLQSTSGWCFAQRGTEIQQVSVGQKLTDKSNLQRLRRISLEQVRRASPSPALSHLPRLYVNTYTDDSC